MWPTVPPQFPFTPFPPSPPIGQDLSLHPGPQGPTPPLVPHGCRASPRMQGQEVDNVNKDDVIDLLDDTEALEFI